MLLHNHMKSSSMNVGLVVLLYVQTRADGPIIIPLHDFSASWSSIQQRSHLHWLHGICYVFLCQFLCVTIFQSTEQPFALITRPLLCFSAEIYLRHDLPVNRAAICINYKTSAMNYMTSAMFSAISYPNEVMGNPQVPKSSIIYAKSSILLVELSYPSVCS